MHFCVFSFVVDSEYHCCCYVCWGGIASTKGSNAVRFGLFVYGIRCWSIILSGVDVFHFSLTLLFPIPQCMQTIKSTTTISRLQSSCSFSLDGAIEMRSPQFILSFLNHHDSFCWDQIQPVKKKLNIVEKCL